MNARIQELQTTCKKEGKESILVFRGFSAPFVRELLQLPQAVLSAETVLGNDGYLHPEQVLASAEALLSALETHSGPAVMIYEQLLALGLSRIPEKWAVWVIDNDLFDEEKPSPLSPEASAACFAALEAGPLTEETEAFLKLYGDIRENGQDCWTVRLLNGHTDAGIPAVPFYGAPAQLPKVSKRELKTARPAYGQDFFQLRLAAQENRGSAGGAFLLDSESDRNDPRLLALAALAEQKGENLKLCVARRENQYD